MHFTIEHTHKKKRKNKRKKQTNIYIYITHPTTNRSDFIAKKTTGQPKLIWKSAVEIPFKSQSIFFLSEAQCHLFPSNFAAEVNNFSHRAAKLGQVIGNNVSRLQ